MGLSAVEFSRRLVPAWRANWDDGTGTQFQSVASGTSPSGWTGGGGSAGHTMELLGRAQTAMRTYQDNPSEQNLLAAQAAWGALQAAIENELRASTEGAPDPDAAINRKSEEIGGRMSGNSAAAQLYSQIVGDAKTNVLGESPETRETELALAEVLGLQETLPESVTGVPFNQLDPENPQHQQWVEANLAFGKAMDAELEAELRKLFPGVQSYTNEQIAQAGNNLKTRYGERYGPEALSQTIDMTVELNKFQRDVGVAEADLRAKLETLDPSMLTNFEKTLWEKGDRTTVAFLRLIGANYVESNGTVRLTLNGETVELSQIEQDLARQDPATVALLKRGGISIDKTELNVPEIKVGDEAATLTPQQQAFANGQEWMNLALSLLPQDPGERISALMAATAPVRIDLTKQEVQTRLQNGDIEGAMKVLSTNMDAAFSMAERAALLEQAGMPEEVRRLFLERIDHATTKADPLSESDEERRRAQSTTMYMDEVGRVMQEFFREAPPELVNMLLDDVKDQFGEDWFKSNQIDMGGYQSDGLEFFKGLSLGIEKLPDGLRQERANEFAEWLLGDTPGEGGPQRDFIFVLRDNGMSFGFSAVRTAIKDGYGSTLADAMLNRINGNEDYQFLQYDFEMAVTQGKDGANESLVKTVNRQSAENFNLDPARIVTPYFDGFKTGPDITAPIAAVEGPELRNMIGRALGLTPDNVTAAEAGDNSVNWFTSDANKVMINLVEGWIRSETDPDWKVRAIPVIYVSPRDGEQKGALFHLQGPDGQEKLIDGLVAPFVVGPQLNALANGTPVDKLPPVEADSAWWKYEDLRHFQDTNQWDDDEGKIYMPYDIAQQLDAHDLERFEGKPGAQVDVGVIKAARFTTGEKVTLVVDIGALVLGTIAGLALIPLTGGTSAAAVAAWWAAAGTFAASTAWQLHRQDQMRDEMAAHGQSTGLDNPAVRDSYLADGLTYLSIVPMFASVRAVTLSRSALGMSRLAGAANSESLAAQAVAMTSRAQNWGQVARVTGGVQAAGGLYFMAQQGALLLEHGDEMSDRDFWTNVFYLTFGASQFALGVKHVSFLQPKIKLTQQTERYIRNVLGLRVAAENDIAMPNGVGLGGYFRLPNGEFRAVPATGDPVTVRGKGGDPSELIVPGRQPEQTGPKPTLYDPTAQPPVDQGARLIVPGYNDLPPPAAMLFGPKGEALAPSSQQDTSGNPSAQPAARGTQTPRGGQGLLLSEQSGHGPAQAQADGAPAIVVADNRPIYSQIDAVPDPTTGAAYIRKDGSIVYRPPGASDPIVIPNRAFVDGRPTARYTEFRGVDDQVRALIGDSRVEGMPRASDRVIFLDDERFDVFYAMFGGEYARAGDADAFTVSRAGGRSQFIIARETPVGGTARSIDLLHETVHYYMNPRFAQAADRFLVEGSDPGFQAPAASLKEGIAEYLAWRIAYGDSGGTYQQHYDTLRMQARNGAEAVYPHATLMAERVIGRMNADVAYDAIFGGDRGAIRLFRQTVLDEANGAVTTTTEGPPQADGAMQIDARFRVSLKPAGKWIARQWTDSMTEFRNWRQTNGYTWKDTKAKVGTATWQAPYWFGGLGQGTQRVVTKKYSPIALPGTIQQGAHNFRMNHAGKKADGAFQRFVTAYDKAVDELNGKAAPGTVPIPHFDPNPTPSAWVQDTVTGAVYLTRVADLFGDVHAHSRPYDGRGNYTFKGMSRFEKLTRQVGVYGRVLIGDIPQACGFSHYSHVNSSPLTLKRAQWLDAANAKAYNRMVNDYLAWDRQMTEAKRINSSAAGKIETAALTQNYEDLRLALDELRQSPGGRRVASRLRHMTRYEWRAKEHRDPFLALRSDRSITGFDPGSEVAWTYVTNSLLDGRTLGQAKTLGEITLQKELVAILLGKEMTPLPHDSIPVFKDFVLALEAYRTSPDPANLQSLKTAYKAFKGDSANTFVQTFIDDFHGAIRKLDTLITAHEPLITAKFAADHAFTSQEPGLTTRKGDLERDISAWDALLTPKNDEITRLEGENEAAMLRKDNYEDQLTRLPLDPANLTQINDLWTKIGDEQNLVLANNRLLGPLRADAATLKSDVTTARGEIDTIDGTLRTLRSDQMRADAAFNPRETRLQSGIRTIDGHLQTFNREVEARVKNFEKVLEVADRFGLGVVLHCDWGEAAFGAEGRPAARDSDYRYAQQLIELVERFPNARVVLAHTGFGRLTRPDTAMVTSNRPGTGPQPDIPLHLWWMYEAKQRAPNVRFDISWNDVGERYTNEPVLLEHLATFITDYPEAVMFGTDTVKPVNREQYQQAFHTLMPLYLHLARRGNGQTLLWKLLRGNFETFMEQAQTSVKTQTVAEYKGDPRHITRMNDQIDVLEAGQKMLAGEAEKLFMREFAFFEASRKDSAGNWLPTYVDASPPFALPAATVDLPQPKPGGAIIPHGAHRPEPRDVTGEIANTIYQRGTATGAPGSKRVQRSAGLQAAGRTSILAGTPAMANLFADAILGGGLMTDLFAADSMLRQTLFMTKLSYREYVRLSWEAIFEEMDASSRNIDIFFNRVDMGSRLAGADPARMVEVAHATAQFKSDIRYIDDVSANWATLFPELAGNAAMKTRWEKTGRKQALMAAIGLYQIRVDRALGSQASSLDIFNPLGKIGRRLNDTILVTTGVSLAGEIRDFIDLMPHKTYPWLWDVQVEQMPEQLRQFFVDWGGFGRGENYLDIAALSLMGGRLVAENYGGKKGTNDLERVPGLRRLQTVILGTFAVRGAVGATHHTLLGIEAYRQRDFGQAGGEGFKAFSEGMIAYYGLKAGFLEHRRQQAHDTADPRAVARANMALVFWLAARAGAEIPGGA